MTIRRFAGYWLVCLVSLTTWMAPLAAQEWKSGVEWKAPPIITPGVAAGDPPSDAIVLFNGTDLSQWEGGDRWLVTEGVAIPQGGDIRTRQTFGDVQLHLEWSAPTEVRGEGQGRGNSGVFLMGLYEVQVLDSFNNTTYFDGQAGAIYKQTPPMVNVMRKPGEWNTYDIVFTAPEFRVNGTLSKPAHVTLIHNGVVALSHFEILGSTGFTAPPAYVPHAEKGPISLQFHNDPVRFRNIWVRELNPAEGHRVSGPFNMRKPTPKKSREDTAVTEPKPEAKPDSKPDAKPDAKPEAKPDAKVEPRPDAKPEVKPDAKVDPKPDSKPDAKPDAKSDAKPTE